MSLEIQGLNIKDVCEEYETPFYIYSSEKIRSQYRKLDEAFNSQTSNYSINYAVKANPNPSVVSLLTDEGTGLDCASRAEMELALRKVDSEDIIFTAPFPPKKELDFAAEKGITVNYNSIKDFERADKIPERVSFRVDPGMGEGNFGLDFGGGSKFGVEGDKIIEAYRKAQRAGVERFGIHMMTGSGILSPGYFGDVTEKLGRISEQITEELGIEFEFVDVGGGLGVPYRPDQTPIDVEKAAENIVNNLESFDIGDPTIMMEPGRYLVAESGTLVTRVQDTLEKSDKTYLGLNSGMHHFLRPMLYDAYHEIEAVEKRSEKFEVDIVGLVCENTDKFAEDRNISKVKSGNSVAIRDVGAYGFAMASNWNTRPIPYELMIEEGKVSVIRENQKWSDVFHGTSFE